MDNLCHSLAGAVIAHSGYARRVPRAVLLGVVAANIPDLDALTYIWADAATAVAFRRGWTHGLPALALWTIVLGALFASWQRRRPAVSSAVSSAELSAALPKAAPASGEAPVATLRDYATLAAIAACSHPVLDWLNSYGVRFLMPFSDRWFYGDALFIVDPPLLVIFGLGWFVSSRALRADRSWAPQPARIALALALAYVTGMKMMSLVTRDTAVNDLRLSAVGPRALMIAPKPVTWLTRDVLVNRGEVYVWSTWRFSGLRVERVGEQSAIESGADGATIAAVRATRDGANFLRWSRFPYFVPDAASHTIFVGDARYNIGTTESWAGIRVPLEQPAPLRR